MNLPEVDERSGLVQSFARARLGDCVALTFASLFPLAMALLYFVILNNAAKESNPALIAAFGVGKFIQFLFPALYVAWFDRGQIRIARPKVQGLLLAFAFSLVVDLLMMALYFGFVAHISSVAAKTPELIFHRLQQLGHSTPAGYARLAFFICVIHSLAEEYYWRWFVFGWMRRHVPLWTAIVLSSIGFTLHHIVVLGVYFPDHFWTLAIPFSLCVGVGGGFWAWLYDRTGSLYAAWLSHCMIDTAILSLGYVMLQDYWK